MSEVQRRGLRRRQVPYRLLSIALSAALLGAGIAMMYHRIAWRDIASLWTRLDPLLVAAPHALY
jgi:DNA-binding transcriptional LysR family regulator